MEIVDNTAVRIRTRNVDRFSIIPKHTATPIPGGHEVLVYWGLDEMRVLKNMGFKVPSQVRVAGALHAYGAPENNGWIPDATS
jgi:hypothetical protein